MNRTNLCPHHSLLTTHRGNQSAEDSRDGAAPPLMSEVDAGTADSVAQTPDSHSDNATAMLHRAERSLSDELTAIAVPIERPASSFAAKSLSGAQETTDETQSNSQESSKEDSTSNDIVLPPLPNGFLSF